MENKFLTKNQTKIYAAYKRCCFGKEIVEAGISYIQGSYDRAKLKIEVYRMLPDLIFDDEKKSETVLIDSLHLFAVLKENCDAEVYMKMNLYQDEKFTYFLEMI